VNEPIALSSTPKISVVICTYNGEATIGPLLQSLLDQNLPDDAGYEVLVVDNNSRDETLAVCQRIGAENAGKIRVFTESQQGKSYALNKGLENVRGELCCIIDQDEILPADYLSTVCNTFATQPSVSFIGGRVLPVAGEQIPQWITREHWSPLAICDYGQEPFTVDSRRFVCLVAGAFRTADMRAVGGYRGPLGIRPGRLGSLEDMDIYERLVNTGKTGRYTPEIVVHHHLGEDRYSRDYHRKWHFGHGRYYSDLRSPEFEGSARRLLDVPGHVFRQAAGDFCKMISHWLKGAREQAFICELRLRFTAGYILQRWKVYSS
jgi:glucosyl-dolichyl phosphate glucuronosyltransferase